MYTLISNISITIVDNDKKPFTISNFPICNVEIKRSRKDLTATAKITMPRNFNFKQSGLSKKSTSGININTFLKRGSKISIALGYLDHGLKTEFIGYITQVSSGFPLVIECQDEMWKLKQVNITKTWKSGTKVNQIAQDVLNLTQSASNTLQFAPEIKISGLVANKNTATQVLEQLRKYGLHSYFALYNTDHVNETSAQLVIDYAESLVNGNTVNYDFSKNIIENQNLNYKLKEDVLIKVDAVSILPNGKKISPKETIGDEDGEIHTLNHYDLSQEALTETAKKEFAKLKYDGYRGYFTTFGLPYAKPGDKAVLIDPDYPDRNGVYLIDAVETSFGTEGFRRKITLERLLVSFVELYAALSRVGFF